MMLYTPSAHLAPVNADGAAPPAHDPPLSRLWTRHATRRAARRNLVPDAIEYVLTNGRTTQRTGITFYFLGWRDVPLADRRQSWATRLIGTIVLVASNGDIITVYRNPRVWRATQRKMKYRCDPRVLRATALPDVTSEPEPQIA